MNDFLQQLRSGNSKRFDKGRRSYDGNTYRNTDRSGGRDRKASSRRRPPDAEQLQAIRGILQAMSDTQKNLVERQVQAVERQADAMDLIATYLSRIMERLSYQPEDETSREPAEDSTERESRPGQPDANALEWNDRQDLVQTIRERREIGDSFSEIAKFLNRQGIPTITGKGQWRAQSVSRLYGHVG